MKQETILKIEITRSEEGQLSVWTEKTGKVGRCTCVAAIRAAIEAEKKASEE
jgi:hypothetical protein